MSNYGDTENGASRQGRHRRMNRYMDQEPAPQQNQPAVPQADPYARPQNRRTEQPRPDSGRNVYDGYERPDENYLKSDEALLSRRSRSFSRSSLAMILATAAAVGSPGCVPCDSENLGEEIG